MTLGHLRGYPERIQRLLPCIPLVIRIEMHVAFWKAKRKARNIHLLKTLLSTCLVPAWPGYRDTAVTTKESLSSRAHRSLGEARVIIRAPLISD